MHILIVEDEKDLRDSYIRQIGIFNKEQGKESVTYEIASTYNEAKEKLINDYDAVFLDLKLSKENKNYDGKSLLIEIKSSLRFISYVITGNPEVIEEEKDNQSPFFRIRVKGEKNSDLNSILSELKETFETGITKILGKKGKIEEYLQTIFWNHLSNSVSLWINDQSRSPEQKEKSLLRYTLLHMQEYLDEKNYHPSEFYISKPIKNEIFTGDIVSFNNERYIVLTPSCDIVLREGGNRNTGKILFCRIKNLSGVVKDYEKISIDSGKNNEHRTRLNKYIQNNAGGNFHFIPKHNNIEPGLIDFQDKITIDTSETISLIESKEIKRIATVSMPFLKDIISRYSNYYSRQGSPDFDSDEVFMSIFS